MRDDSRYDDELFGGVMANATIGTIASLWRHPVKSMLGETVDMVEITERGIFGDRAYGVVDKETGKLVSAKNPRKWAGMFQCRAAFGAPPRRGNNLPPVRITLPDGTVLNSDDPRVHA